MNQYADFNSREVDASHVAEDAVTAEPLINNPGKSIIALLFIWFVAPFVAYLSLVAVFGILILSFQIMEYFAVPERLALVTSILMTAAAVKVIFKSVCRAIHEH